MTIRQIILIITFSVCAVGALPHAWAQNVVLLVDRETGSISIANNDATTGHVALYEVTSELGIIDASGWVPFANSDSSWRVLGTPTANRLTEIKETGELQISQGVPMSIGVAYDPGPAKLASGFGVDVEDLRVQLFDPLLDTLASPEVEYVGEKIYNNLVVNINALTGQASIENESPFDVELTGYTIGSSAGELNSAWAGLRASDPDNWLESGISSSTSVAELNQNGNTAALSLTAGSSADLGFLYTGDGTIQDVSFDFILQGQSTLVSSAVKYSNIDFAGDADGDTDVDGADFLTLQRIASHQIPTWETNYGNGLPLSALTNSIPEPSSALLVLLGMNIASGSFRIRRFRSDLQRQARYL